MGRVTRAAPVMYTFARDSHLVAGRMTSTSSEASLEAVMAVEAVMEAMELMQRCTNKWSASVNSQWSTSGNANFWEELCVVEQG